VIAKFSESFGIELDDVDSKKMTNILRSAFSPDTTPDSMHTYFPEISSDFFYQIGMKISKIREEARNMKNTKTNIQRWNSQTDSIIKEIYDEYTTTKK